MGDCSMYFEDMCTAFWVTAVCILRIYISIPLWLTAVFRGHLYSTLGDCSMYCKNTCIALWVTAVCISSTGLTVAECNAVKCKNVHTVYGESPKWAVPVDTFHGPGPFSGSGQQQKVVFLLLPFECELPEHLCFLFCSCFCCT